MTTNQLAWLELQEKERSNRANEEITSTRDVNNLKLNYAILGETRRHNAAQELHNTAVLGETARHNQETEAAAWSAQDLEADRQRETQRHNLQAEELEGRRLGEVERHNLRTEELEVSKQDLSERMANADRASREMIAEYDRNSREWIAEQDRGSREWIAEQDRESREWIAQGGWDTQLALQDQQLSLRQQELDESRRHNIESEYLNQMKINNDYRVDVRRNTETRRHNLETERETKANNLNQTIHRWGDTLIGAASRNFSSVMGAASSILKFI